MEKAVTTGDLKSQGSCEVQERFLLIIHLVELHNAITLCVAWEFLTLSLQTHDAGGLLACCNLLMTGKEMLQIMKNGIIVSSMWCWQILRLRDHIKTAHKKTFKSKVIQHKTHRLLLV